LVNNTLLMMSKLLLPHRYKLIGLLIFIPFLILGIAVYFYDFGFGFLQFQVHIRNGIFDNNRQDLTDELALTGLIAGLLFIAFSREKQEDEFISRVRLESLQWAVLINYILLLIATWVVYNISYIDVMMYNMLTVLLIFIIRFHILLWRNSYSANHPNP
jgi:hypothetical protein